MIDRFERIAIRGVKLGHAIDPRNEDSDAKPGPLTSQMSKSVDHPRKGRAHHWIEPIRLMSILMGDLFIWQFLCRSRRDDRPRG